MMENANVAVAPGIGFGEEGEGFLRLALVENEHRIRQALRQMRRALSAFADELDISAALYGRYRPVRSRKKLMNVQHRTFNIECRMNEFCLF
jgi:Zn-dependent oligopeptidase